MVGLHVVYRSAERLPGVDWPAVTDFGRLTCAVLSCRGELNGGRDERSILFPFAIVIINFLAVNSS